MKCICMILVNKKNCITTNLIAIDEDHAVSNYLEFMQSTHSVVETKEINVRKDTFKNFDVALIGTLKHILE